MNFEEVDVFIDKDGQVRIEVRGVKGSHCLTVTKDLENSLGGQVETREMTPEASEPPAENEQQQHHQQGR